MKLLRSIIAIFGLLWCSIAFAGLIPPGFSPTFGVGAPNVAVPKNQLYFDTGITPYNAYVWNKNLSAWAIYSTIGLSQSGSFGTLFPAPVLISRFSFAATPPFLLGTMLDLVGGAGVSDTLVNWSFGAPAVFNGQQAEGDPNSGLTATLNGDELAEYDFSGYVPLTNGIVCGSIQGVATQNWTATHAGTKLVFNICLNSTNVPTLTGQIAGDGSLLWDTFSPCGLGCINAVKVEVQGAPVTVAIPLMFKLDGTPPAGTTCFLSVSGTTATNCTTQVFVSQLWQRASTFGALAGVSGSGLNVNLGGAPGAGNSITFTLMVSGVASGVTCTVSSLATACSDTTDSVAVPAGAMIAYQVVTSAVCSASLPAISITASGP